MDHKITNLTNHLSENGTVLAVSPAIAKIAGLSALVGASVDCSLTGLFDNNATAVLAWGRKSSARKAELLARIRKLPVLRLEDGFLRSTGLGHTQPYSLVLDDIGIYYDASMPSRLELLIQQHIGDAEFERAKALQQLWRISRVSKYNHAADQCDVGEPFVLVVDQTWGDASVAYGLGSEASFSQMLEQALLLYPEHQVVVKVHPDVVAGKKRGYFVPEELRTHSRIVVLAHDIHPPALLEKAAAVFTVTSQLGFEALLWGCTVHCFGMPFYAGWGLTEDALPSPSRRKPVSLEQLVHAALVDYVRYLDPLQLKPCEPEQLIRYFAAIRAECDYRHRAVNQHRKQAWVAFQMPLWKRPHLQRFLVGQPVRFIEDALQISPDSEVLVWGMKDVRHLSSKRIHRVEDGFVRSIGLGAELRSPLSWVIDPIGIYYDASQASTLEQELQNLDLTAGQMHRARMLKDYLVTQGMTKYNLTAVQWHRPQAASRVVLVVGQVETDASIRLGSPAVFSNGALLQKVRALYPEHYIVYKPHPDEVAGLRQQSQKAEQFSKYCNEIVSDASIVSLIEQADQIHVMTSLAGFEALIRGKEVHCHGMPFYAGWGLTVDYQHCSRRQRRLSVDELVYGTLIRYALYLSPLSGQKAEPEQAIRELSERARVIKLSGFLQMFRRFMVRTFIGVK